MAHQPVYVMLVGLPASGKSTFRKILEKTGQYYILSSDDIIESECNKVGITYSDGFTKFISEATKKVIFNRNVYCNDDYPVNVIDDHTNMSRKSRHDKMKDISNKYIKICYVFPELPKMEWERRLEQRKDKHIPHSALITMKNAFQEPSYHEGFHIISHVMNY
jgi:tRNA uridine 5-carbamoylmethylation protein Kti12